MSGFLFWFALYIVVMLLTLWFFTILMRASRDDRTVSDLPAAPEDRRALPHQTMANPIIH